MATSTGRSVASSSSRSMTTEIWRVREGRSRMMVDGVHLDVRAGELVVLPPNVEHGVVLVEEGTGRR
jgi:mannose-6-phosphate isomerase-like protein (cupin superfamily)